MFPNRAEAEQMLLDAQTTNPGEWVQHSQNVALAAERIAEQHPTLDAGRAYTLGLLHDIGRRTGPNSDRHILDGYDYLIQLGFTDPARIALTHSFVISDVATLQGKWDGSPTEFERLESLLRQAEINDEDRLLQLCDALALADGFCTIQERIVDIALRYSINEQTLPKWRAILDLKSAFDQLCGVNVYRLLPGLTERLLK